MNEEELAAIDEWNDRKFENCENFDRDAMDLVYRLTAEIRRLSALSSSQEEAHAARDRGAKV